MSCWRSPCSRLMRSKTRLNCWNWRKLGLRMSMSTLSLVCSGATFSLPLTWWQMSSRVYSSAERLAASSGPLYNKRS